ncbi:predicted protein [Streptomyces lividans TK24]|uniref:Uncharacterized protein n=1 Tax=Streptomyces lividans 1326 TaxID=1200984 RepID=A0A7U9HDY1_STRLI|nr:predicted protein [Streptomyces lividans TK24]EOY50238.1 hypothetical protein SLI_5530 [Streptomyces lividans 1326]
MPRDPRHPGARREVAREAERGNDKQREGTTSSATSGTGTAAPEAGKQKAPDR